MKMKKTYNKLVRDKIPEIIEKNGKTPIYRVLDELEFLQALKNKVIEEAKELCEASTEDEIIEECGDILTVLMTIGTHLGIDGVAMLERADEKLTEKGGFDKRYFLENIES